jgi:peptidoglycan/LPS O-acetylase OafA/YrhL
MGMFIGYFTLKKKYLPTSFSLIAFFLSLAYILLTVDALQLPRFLENGVPAAILVWSIISLEMYLQGRIPRMIMFFGSASYALYLFHPLIVPVVPEILKRLSLGSFTISVICSIIVSMIASAAIHRWIELPCTSAIRNYKNRSIVKQKKEPGKGFIKQKFKKE